MYGVRDRAHLMSLGPFSRSPLEASTNLQSAAKATCIRVYTIQCINNELHVTTYLWSN